MDVTNVTQYPSRNVNTSITVKPGINANPILQSKQVVLIRSVPTYLRCIADQTRSKYDQPTLYRRPPRGTPAQHTTCGERDHPTTIFQPVEKLIPLTTTSQSGPNQSPLYVRPRYAFRDQCPLIADPSIFSRAGESGGWSGLWCERHET